jgi:hypothetical protein
MAELPKDDAFGVLGLFICHSIKYETKEINMRNTRFIKAIMYILVSLTLTLTSCGGGGGGTPPSNTGVGQVMQVSGVSVRTAELKTISITPSNPLGINSGTRLNFNATGSYSDNSVQDLTMMVVWTSSNTSVTTVSNAPDSKGQARAVSRGYCSISAAMGGISGSTIVGIM